MPLYTTGNNAFGCYSGNQTVWVNWQQPYTTGAVTVSNENIWYQWNQDGFQCQMGGQQQMVTAEQLLELERETRIRAEEPAQHAKAAEDQKRAEAQAEALLLLYLSKEQKKQYKELGYFDTEVNDRKYRLHRGRAGNIQELDQTGKPVAKLCVHPVDWLPHSDNVLAQLLALLANEQELRAIANHTRL